MPTVTLGIISTLYLFTSLGYLKEGKLGFAITFFCYALANAGMIWEGIK